MSTNPYGGESDSDRFFRELDAEMLRDPDSYAKRYRAAQTLFNGGDPDTGDVDESRAGYIPRMNMNDHRYYTLGIQPIDSLAGDIRPVELIAIGASTGHGKSALGQHIALENSLRHKVLFYSLEMDQELVEERMLGQLMGVDLNGVAAGRLTAAPDYDLAMQELKRRDLVVLHPKPSQRSLGALTKHAARLGTDVLIIDYASKIKHWEPGKVANGIISDLWEWIKETRTATFLLAQTKRPATPGGKRYRPTVHDFADSREIENTCTRAVMLWRPYHGTRRDTIAELTIGKNRFGREFRAHAHWTGSTGSLQPMADDDEKIAPCCRPKVKAPPATLVRRNSGALDIDPDFLMELEG